MIQKRNIAMYIILSIVTCGIFGIYWFICLTDDSKLAANDNESASGPVAFLLTIVTCGIYSWYWAYKLGDRVDYAANSRGIGDGSSNSKILFIFFAFCGENRASSNRFYPAGKGRCIFAAMPCFLLVSKCP